MSRKIKVEKKSSIYEGSCNACTNHTKITDNDIRVEEHDVYVVTLRSISVRLCEECKDDLENNPLNLFNCNEEDCQILAELAPKLENYLCEDCKSYLNKFVEIYSTVAPGGD